jgi:hypothetical protein
MAGHVSIDGSEHGKYARELTVCLQSSAYDGNAQFSQESELVSRACAVNATNAQIIPQEIPLPQGWLVRWQRACQLM